jgi:hypothetical protein
VPEAAPGDLWKASFHCYGLDVRLELMPIYASACWMIDARNNLSAGGYVRRLQHYMRTKRVFVHNFIAKYDRMPVHILAISSISGTLNRAFTHIVSLMGLAARLYSFLK